jgi:hypothetical protein
MIEKVFPSHWLLCVCLLGWIFPLSASALPAQIVILRHAEKPESGNHLSPKGYARAQALVGFWRAHPVARAYGDPVAFYASYSPDKSLRSVETLAPSAGFYRAPLFSHHAKDQTEALAHEILNRPEFHGRTVVVAWQHTNIIPMLRRLGVQNAPPVWPDEIFNRIAVVRFAFGPPARFGMYPQCLLPGDCL